MQTSALLQGRDVTQSFHYSHCRDLRWVSKFLGTQMVISAPPPVGGDYALFWENGNSLSFVGDKMTLHDSNQTKLLPTCVVPACLEFGCKMGIS